MDSEETNLKNRGKEIKERQNKSAQLKREVEGGSAFTPTSDLSCIASIFFATEKFTDVRT